MKNFAILSVVTIQFVFFFSETASSQTLNNILAKLQTVEERLEELESASPPDITTKLEQVEYQMTSYETTHQQELREVHSRLEQIDPSAFVPIIEKHLSEYLNLIEKRLDDLQQEITGLRNDSGTIGNESLELVVEDLRGQINNLKNSPESHWNSMNITANQQAQTDNSVTVASAINNKDRTETFPHNLNDDTRSVNSAAIDYTRLPFEIEHVYSSEYFSKVSGGMDKRNRGDYRGHFDLVLSTGSEALGLWKGTNITMDFQNGNGKGISESYVGDMQVISNIDADNFTQISEYVLSHSFGDGRFMLKLGKQDANADFNAADNAGDFINSSFGIMPNVPLPTFPDPGLGIAAFYSLSENLQINAGVYDGCSDGGTWGFNTAFGSERESSSVVEVVYGSGIVPFFERRGTFKMGVWRHDGLYSPVAGTGDKSENIGGYFIIEQGIFGDTESDNRYLDMFFQYGYADGDINTIPHYAGIGFKTEGLFAGRSEDSMGIGAAFARVNPELKDMKSETTFEYYYQTNISDKVILQPDVQYIVNPGGVFDNALVTGLRVYLNF